MIISSAVKNVCNQSLDPSLLIVSMKERVCFTGQLMQFLDKMDAFIYKVCPFVAAGLMVGSCYWVAVTYGAITLMQVVNS